MTRFFEHNCQNDRLNFCTLHAIFMFFRKLILFFRMLAAAACKTFGHLLR